MNRALGTRGLSKVLQAIKTMGNPRDALQALAMGIQSHENFRAVLAKVEPDKRRECYEALRGLISFKAKPLDEYMTDSRIKAEHDRLPTYDEATGTITAFEPARNTGVFLPHATLTCYKCTRQEDFHAETVVGARIMAVNRGWYFDAMNERWICPKCPAPRSN